MTAASSQELNEFVKVVDEFMVNYGDLTSPAMRNEVYNSRNPALIADYETAVSRGGTLKATIETTVGAWSAAKRAYADMTDTTSTAIGDAIDEIRSWFGYDPAGGLGALQIPAAAWVAGIIASAALLNGLMKKIFVAVHAARIRRSEPNVSHDDSVRRAKELVGGNLLGQLSKPLWLAGAALLAYVLWNR